MIKRTEIEIMKNWTYSEPLLLSVASITYNHEDYISEALDGILMQKTDFPFEIIVHDDCSVDNTVNILKEYVKKYPNIIKLILQKENQYSQGKKIFKIISQKVKGTYIAWCEGDDYWVDTGKLQIQIDSLKQNPDCDMSFHAAEMRHGRDKHGKIIAKHNNENKIFSTSEVIMGGGGFCPSASIVMRKEVWTTLPGFFDDVPVGDYFLQIFGSLSGGALYIDKVMSVYRQNVSGSWSSRMKNINKQEEFYYQMIESFDKVNLYLNNKYQKEIDIIKSKSHYEISLAYFDNHMYKHFQKTIEKSFNLYKLNSLSYLLFYYLRHFPFLIKSLKKLKGID